MDQANGFHITYWKSLHLKNIKQMERGITFEDVIEKFHCKKEKAQRKLMNACIEHVKDGKKSSVLFRLNDDRTNPQRFFPSCIKAKVIENKRKRLIGTTGGYLLKQRTFFFSLSITQRY